MRIRRRLRGVVVLRAIAYLLRAWLLVVALRLENQDLIKNRIEGMEDVEFLDALAHHQAQQMRVLADYAI
ncbi:hypothetical protein LFM09_09180 [Lentzea alba]|uniref:hypothetical protein n=1 Tax=Lentzea alba TaxID=2714351 RepID=UPI0039BF406C